MKTYIIELNRKELIKLFTLINSSPYWNKYIDLNLLNNNEHFKLELNEYELKRLKYLVERSCDYDFHERSHIIGMITSAFCYWKLKKLKEKNKDNATYN